MSGQKLLVMLFYISLANLGCAPVEYSVVIARASRAIIEAENEGASCTKEQLSKRSPIAKKSTPSAGTELASSDEASQDLDTGKSGCVAPYEYYAAVAYRAKAREEVSYSDYEAALTFAHRSQQLALKAKSIAQGKSIKRGTK